MGMMRNWKIKEVIYHEKELLFSLTKKDLLCNILKPVAQVDKRKIRLPLLFALFTGSGARAEGKEERSQTANKRNAFKRLIETKELKTGTG